MNSVKLQDMKLIYKKPVACLYKNDELEREIKKIIQLTTASKRTKYQGINLTKNVKDPYTENFKTMMNKPKKTQITADTCAHGTEELVKDTSAHHEYSLIA